MGLSISRSVNLGPLSISVTIGGPEEAPSPSRTKRYERPPGTLMPDGRRLPDMRVWDEPKPDEGSPFRGKNSSPGGATKGATIEDEAAELYEEQVDGVRRDLMKELDAASDEELEHLMSIFQSLDSDGDLYVDVGELGFGMERLHRAISDREVRRLFGEADTDGDGYIDFEEFAAVAVRHRKAKEAAEDEKELLGDVFKVFDADGSGFIDRGEIHKIFKGLETDDFPAPPIEMVDELLRDADLDGDGKINYAEFVKVMTSSDSSFSA